MKLFPFITICVSSMLLYVPSLCAEDIITELDYCWKISEMAGNIMEKHQDGVPVHQLIEEFSRADVYGAEYLAEPISNHAATYPRTTNSTFRSFFTLYFKGDYRGWCAELYWFNKRNP